MRGGHLGKLLDQAEPGKRIAIKPLRIYAEFLPCLSFSRTFHFKASEASCTPCSVSNSLKGKQCFVEVLLQFWNLTEKLENEMGAKHKFHSSTPIQKGGLGTFSRKLCGHIGCTKKHRHRRNVMSYRFKSLFKLFSLFLLSSLLWFFSLLWLFSFL